jgi:hypothetical protein
MGAMHLFLRMVLSQTLTNAFLHDLEAEGTKELTL